MASIENFKDMKVFLGEWSRYKDKFDEDTIHHILKHELAHIFSLERSKIKNGYSIDKDGPINWLNDYTAPVSPSLYEGATEMMAIFSDIKRDTETKQQGYIAGSTLSAFVLSEIIGKEKFIKAYLKHDPKMLRHELSIKFGQTEYDEYGPNKGKDILRALCTQTYMIDYGVDVLYKI